MLGIANPVWVLLVLTVVFSAVLHLTRWGRHLYAIGGNEQAALLTGVPVARVKLAAYIVSAMMAALAAVLIIGWQGSAINALGTGYELRVIASTVIGGANLMGGEGGAYGAFIGAALIEVIRNSLLMAGVDSNWQGTFVGVFIVLAVLLEKLRGRRRGVKRNREEATMKTYLAGAAALLLALAAAHPGCGGRQEIRLRPGAEEHEQPVLRSGARRLQEGREGAERRGRVPLHRPRRAWRRRGAGAGGERPDRATGRRHRGIAVECAGDGPRAAGGAEGRAFRC